MALTPEQFAQVREFANRLDLKASAALRDIGNVALEAEIGRCREIAGQLAALADCGSWGLASEEDRIRIEAKIGPLLEELESSAMAWMGKPKVPPGFVHFHFRKN